MNKDKHHEPISNLSPLFNLGFGGSLFLLGALFTFASYSAATTGRGGDGYVLAWGAIVFGGLQLLIGLIQVASMVPRRYIWLTVMALAAGVAAYLKYIT